MHEVTEASADIPMGEGAADGDLYQPPGSGAWPGILMLTDGIGIRTAKRAMARRLAPEAMVARLEAALKAWGGRYESEFYPGALHGWTVPGNPAYNELQAERHFGKLKELFAAQRS
jgi:dienelactone hydrolase